MPTRLNLNNFTTAAQTGTTVPVISAVTVTDSNYQATGASTFSTAGGYARITGALFKSGTQVFVRNSLTGSSTLSANIAYVSSQQLNASMPANTAGVQMLLVVNPDGYVCTAAVTYA